MNTDKTINLQGVDLYDVADKLSSKEDLFPDHTARAKELLSEAVVLDKQPQIEKTAAEFLFEYGINTMSLNDDFNCQLFFAMERYAEYYASYQRDIKIGDKVAFNYTDKQPQTVYVRCKSEFAHASIFFPPKHDKSILNGMPLPVQEIQNVYIFTPEELEALLQKERREAAEKALNWVHDFEIECPRMHKQEYLNQHYPLPQPPKQ